MNTLETKEKIFLQLIVDDTTTREIEVWSSARQNNIRGYCEFHILPGQNLPPWFTFELFSMELEYDEYLQADVLIFSIHSQNWFENDAVMKFMIAAFRTTGYYHGQEIESDYKLVPDRTFTEKEITGALNLLEHYIKHRS
jgi:hypothetical protein